jgi:hypothetical protein
MCNVHSNLFGNVFSNFGLRNNATGYQHAWTATLSPCNLMFLLKPENLFLRSLNCTIAYSCDKEKASKLSNTSTFFVFFHLFLLSSLLAFLHLLRHCLHFTSSFFSDSVSPSCFLFEFVASFL